MEEGLTEPDLELDDPEQLVREAVRESFSWWRPKARPRSGGSCINDLITHRWYGSSPTPDREVIRRIQSADICGPLRLSFRGFEDFAELLARYHRTVLKVANGHMPKYWRARRSSLRDKHTHAVFYEDLVAAGVAAMWKAALKFDLTAGYAFWTAAGLPVTGAISDEARWWRRGRGGSGETQLDRWLYTHPNATPDQVLETQAQLYKRPVFHSLQEAADGIKLFWSSAGDSEFDFDDKIVVVGHALRVMYGFFDPYQLSPYRKIHERFSALIDRLTGGLDTGPDVGEVSRPKKPRNLYDERRKAAAGYRIAVTPELQAQALQDLEFAEQRWLRRIRRGPMPAKQYLRWSTKFGAGRAEHENKQIIPAHVSITRFTWKVEYRGAEGDLLSVLESPSWHCLKPTPCEFCEEVRGRSRSHHVALAGIPPSQTLPRRAVGRRSAAVDVRSKDSRTKPRTAETRLEEKCQTQFAKQIATSRQEKHSSPSVPHLPKPRRRTSRAP